MKHKTQKKRPKPKIVRTANYNCAHVEKIEVPIIEVPCYPPDSHQSQLSIGGQKIQSNSNKLNLNASSVASNQQN